MQNEKIWEVKVYKCPHCNALLDVCSSGFTERKAIGIAITISELHTNICRGKNPKKLANVYITEVKKISKTTSMKESKNQKILI